MARAGHQVGNRVQAGAMRHRRGVDHGVLRRHGVHIDEVGQAHRHEIALGEHHALRAAGGAAGVEQPGHIVGVALGHGNGRGIGHRGQQGVGRFRFDVDLSLQPGQRLRRDVARDEAPARLRIRDDPLDFPHVQLGVDGHHHQARPPRGPHDLEVTRVVAHEQQHAVAWRQPGVAHALRQRGAAARPVAMGGVQVGAVVDRGAMRVLEGATQQQVGKAHRASPVAAGGRSSGAHGRGPWRAPGRRHPDVRACRRDGRCR